MKKLILVLSIFSAVGLIADFGTWAPVAEADLSGQCTGANCLKPVTE